MLRRIILAAVGCLLAIPAHAGATNHAVLRERLARALAEGDAPGAIWGAQVASLRTGETWFETNPAVRLVPASNTKLFTAALALDRLGPARRLSTSLRIEASPDASGKLAGPLRLVGGGDPSLSPRLHGGAWDEVWAPLVAAVKRAGIRRIDGGLLCDESRYSGPPFGSGWNWDDLVESYGAPVSALSAGDNVVSLIVTPGRAPGEPALIRMEPLATAMSLEASVVTSAKGGTGDLSLFRLPGDSRLRISGSIPAGSPAVTVEAAVPNPALWSGQLFQEALRKAGIAVSGPLRVIRSGESSGNGTWTELGSVASPPVSELVRDMMKPSQNLHAQLLLLAVGAESGATVVGSAARTTEAAGLAALPSLLRKAGIREQDVSLEEGSGLSRKNLVTARALVRLLTFMNRHPAAAVWRDSLPIGGVDGTLRSRFTQPGLRGNVRAKTGSLRHVHSLSGYLTNSVGEPLVFSILVNGAVSQEGSPSAREAMDAWVTILAESSVK
ncbi:MAG: D-alanyl-D-alanine carboxypeptidase/D-alanyl-D-alanine-endopeptidase [Verrucomicrobiota bacterium]